MKLCGIDIAMSRRRLLLGMGSVALLGVAGFVLLLWLTTPTPGVTWENFRRLRKGMSARHVEAVLGEQSLPDVKQGIYTLRLWRGEEVAMSLTFESGVLHHGSAFPAQYLGQTVIKGYVHGEQVPSSPAEETFLDRIRRLLHL
jgi:hypothetical protein